MHLSLNIGGFIWDITAVCGIGIIHRPLNFPEHVKNEWEPNGTIQFGFCNALDYWELQLGSFCTDGELLKAREWEIVWRVNKILKPIKKQKMQAKKKSSRSKAPQRSRRFRRR